MLQPKRTKFRKMQKGRVKGIATRGHSIDFGSFAVKSLEAGWITSRQIEAARISMTRAMKREGQVWIRIFPDKPITKSLLKYGWVKVKVHRILGSGSKAWNYFI
jgi:large subunit ribosomal protein L16